jgi:hypothetical protein
MANASPSQLFALYLATGKCLELRQLGPKLSLDTAKSMISRIRDNQEDPNIVMQELLALGATTKTNGPTVVHAGSVQKWEPKPRVDYQAIYNEADEAGKAAANAKVPTPMVVTDHAVPFDESSPIKQAWLVPGGMCGFAWVQFAGNTAWAKWTKSKGLCGEGYPKGRQIWVSQYSQSMELKEAYAYAFAQVLNKHGIKAYAGSRAD